MPDERSEPSHPSWRRKASPAPRTERPRHEWTKRRPRPVGEAKLPSSGIFKILAALLGFLTCLATVVVLIILIWPPSSVAVVLVGADYADNLMIPHNILGWKGMEAIDALVRTPPPWTLLKPARFELIGGLHKLDQPDDWDKVVKDLVKRRFKQETILIVLALHGGSDSEGAYLCPDRMARPQERLNLSHVIESMADLPPEKQKILVLEATQVPSNWQLGMLHNDFARRLDTLEDEIRKVPNLWVLSGADKDQRCWASEGLGRTVFSHYLIEALRGRAAGDDGRLSLDELHRFVSKQVRNWVWNARAAIQEPVLLPRARRKSDRGGSGASDGKPPGENGTSETASRRPASEVFLATVASESAAQVQEPSDQDLPAAWRDFGELDSLIPHPAVYSPRRWRQYRAELIRFDELVRAGASEQVSAPIHDRIVSSQAILEQERFLKAVPSSAENSLAMSALEGPGGEPEASASEFIAFWKAERGSDAAKAWEVLRRSESSAGQGRVSVRLRGDDFLLLQASRDPGKDLESVAEKLEITRGHDYPQPAEVHFVRMLARRLKPLGKQPQKLLAAVSQAILLRRQAERTALGASSRARDYSYCEQIYPWIGKRVETADAERRLGEDQLFAADESAWDQAATALGKSRLLYTEIASRAATIREALAARDHALANLPGFSHWVADRYADELQGELISRIENLWEKTHLLTAKLESANDQVDLVVLRQAAGELSEGIKQLSTRFSELAERIDTNRLKEDWEASSAAAAVPFGDTGGRSTREKLWERIANIKKHDREMAGMELSDAAKMIAEQRAEEEKRTRARAETQGLMSLAALGEWWFDDREVFAARGQGDYASTIKRVRAARESGLDQGQPWWRDIAAAGDRIGSRWQRMAGEIDRLTDEQNGIPDFHAFQDRLVKADRLERLIDGGWPRLADSTIQASIRLREARVHTLLLGMADRAWEDHWYDEDPKERYYHAVGSRFINDAENYFPQSATILAARGRLDRQGRIALDGPPRMILTSESEGRIAYHVTDEGIVPAGLPVVRPITEPPLELDPAAKGFHVVPRGQAKNVVANTVYNPLGDRFEKDPNENRPRVVPSLFWLDGFFRGQEFTGTTAVAIHPVPDTVAIGPPPSDPPDASIAVRASKEIIARFGAGTGSVAIVLDCSGSMLDQTGAGRTKFDEAQAALSEVLPLVPPKTKLSLWTFSLAPEGVRILPNGNADPTSIPPGFENLRQEPELTVKPFLPMAPWNPERAAAIIGQIGQLHPFFETPLVEAMWMAANQDLKSATGLKTLLVLTDGDDNQLEKFNPKYNPNRLSVKDFIVAGFKPLGITVNMVFFTPAGDKKEIERAKDRFGPALVQLEPRGSFRMAKDLRELIATLQRGLIQKLTCQILKPDGTPVDDEPLDVTDPNAEERWCRGLKPGVYKLRVHAGSNLDQDIDLRNGDRIIVELVEDQAGAVVFRRGLYTASNEFAGRSRVENEAWRLTPLANQVRQDGDHDRLQMATALERKPDENVAGEIQQVKPRMAWFRLGAEDVEHPESRFMTRWRERVFYPGPVWQFDVPRWIPGPAGDRFATPILKAWWSNPESKLEPASELRFDSPGNLGEVPRVLRLGAGKTVIIESIGLEDHRVEVAPGEPTQSKPCLVVRLAFAGDHPCLVDPASLSGLQIVGHEHRVYSQAGKYTGLFWPVNPPQFQRLAGLGLIALDEFRGQAEKQNMLEIKLGQPTVESQIPAPPNVPFRSN